MCKKEGNLTEYISLKREGRVLNIYPKEYGCGVIKTKIIFRIISVL